MLMPMVMLCIVMLRKHLNIEGSGKRKRDDRGHGIQRVAI